MADELMTETTEGTAAVEAALGAMPGEAADAASTVAEAGDGEVVILTSRGETETIPANAVRSFRLGQTTGPGELDFRRLQLRHEQFARSLSARFSMLLRAEFNINLVKQETKSYADVIGGFADPTHVAMFRVEPLRGISLFEMPRRLALTMIDRMMGGPAHSVEIDQDLTDVELSLLDQAVGMAVQEWCDHWTFGDSLRPNLLGHESSPKYIQTAPPDELMLCLVLEASIGDCIETINVAMPYASLSLLLRELGRTESGDEGEIEAETCPPWNRRFDDLTMKVSSRCAGPVMSVEALSQLSEGDVIPLEGDFLQNAELFFGSESKFIGRVGKVNGRWALQLTQDKNGGLDTDEDLEG